MLSHHQKTEIMFSILQSVLDSFGYVSWNYASLMDKHSCCRAVEYFTYSTSPSPSIYTHILSLTAIKSNKDAIAASIVWYY